jgi:hypothetical protein
MISELRLKATPQLPEVKSIEFVPDRVLGTAVTKSNML